MLQKRVEGLERQISMYERLFQSFSSKLDHHFKKYDVLVSSQQQQINILTEALSTMLNDQYRYNEILRDKLGTALSSVSATHVNIAGLSNQRMQDNQKQQQQQQQQQQQTQPLSNVTAFLEDFIAPDVPLSNAVPRRAKLGSFQTKQTTALNPTPDQDTGFRPLEVDVPVPSGVAVEDSQQQVQQQQIQNNSGSGKRKHRTTNGDGSSSKKINRSLPMPDSTSADGHRQSQEPQASHIADEKYYTSRGQSKKRKVYTGNFKFFNSPQSIMDIWKEYTEGFEGQPSIKEMEQMYHVSWRREPAMNKRYHRRRVLCKAIERGLEKGFHLDDVLRMLEDARVIDAERGTKHSISWICQFSHIPEILR